MKLPPVNFAERVAEDSRKERKKETAKCSIPLRSHPYQSHPYNSHTVTQIEDRSEGGCQTEPCSSHIDYRFPRPCLESFMPTSHPSRVPSGTGRPITLQSANFNSTMKLSSNKKFIEKRLHKKNASLSKNNRNSDPALSSARHLESDFFSPTFFTNISNKNQPINVGDGGGKDFADFFVVDPTSSTNYQCSSASLDNIEHPVNIIDDPKEYILVDEVPEASVEVEIVETQAFDDSALFSMEKIGSSMPASDGGEEVGTEKIEELVVPTTVIPGNMIKFDKPIANEILLLMTKGMVSKEEIRQALEHKKNNSTEEMYQEEYQEALKVAKGRLVINPLLDDGDVAQTFIREDDGCTVTEIDDLTERIGRHIEFDFTHRKMFEMSNNYWRKKHIYLSDMTKIPRKSLGKLAAIIQHVLLEITENPQDIQFFSMSRNYSPNSIYIAIPEEVELFLKNFLCEAAQFPEGILTNGFSLEKLRIENERYYQKLGETVEDKFDKFHRLKLEAQQFWLLARNKLTEKLGYLRSCRITRTSTGAVITVRMNSKERDDWRKKLNENVARISKAL